MKAQSLPISTIVIIVIAVVVLAAVLLFFFGAFGKPQSTVNDQNFVAYCNTIVEHVQNSNPTNKSEAQTLATDFGFCHKEPKYGNRACGEIIHPVVHTLNDGDCRLECTSYGTDTSMGAAQCS